MDPIPDDLAGTVDGFGGLTRGELVDAFADLAARAGADLDRSALDQTIDDAIEDYYLLEVDPSALNGARVDAPLLVAGPAALPRLPEGGEDLPHLVDVEPRVIDRAAAAREVEGRLRADAATALADGDAAQAERLLDACYEVEAWGPVDLADAKSSLGALVDGRPQD